MGRVVTAFAAAALLLAVVSGCGGASSSTGSASSTDTGAAADATASAGTSADSTDTAVSETDARDAGSSHSAGDPDETTDGDTSASGRNDPADSASADDADSSASQRGDAVASPRVLRDPSGTIPPGWSVRAVGGSALVHLPADATRGTTPNVADPVRPIHLLSAVTSSAAYSVTWERYPAGAPEMRGPVAEATLDAIVENYVDVPELDLAEVEQEPVVALGLPAIDVTATDRESGLDMSARAILLSDGAMMLSAVADGRAAAARALDQLYDTVTVN